eukprot:scaffold41633_cov49-Phaeocystis_antarctica.AAC.3
MVLLKKLKRNGKTGPRTLEADQDPKDEDPRPKFVLTELELEDSRNWLVIGVGRRHRSKSSRDGDTLHVSVEQRQRAVPAGRGARRRPGPRLPRPAPPHREARRTLGPADVTFLGVGRRAGHLARADVRGGGRVHRHREQRRAAAAGDGRGRRRARGGARGGGGSRPDL